MTSKPRALSQLPQRELISQTTGENYSSVRSLSEAFQLKDLLIHQETLLPGHRASAPHYHSHKEELIYILEGQAVAQVDGECHSMKAGDCMGFPPSSQSHQLINDSEETVVFLSIGTCPSEDQTIFTDD